MVNGTANYIPQQYLYHLGQNGNVLNKKTQMKKSSEAVNYDTFQEALKNTDVVDLAEKYSQQDAEAAAAPKKTRDDLVIITEEELRAYWAQASNYLFEHTGDPKQDKIIELTLH